jgi:hypothetical protein
VSRPDRPEDPREALRAAAGRSALGRLTPGEAPDARAVFGAIGGVRGLVESILPGLAFLIVYTITQDLVLSVAVPVAVAVGFVVVRLATRQPVTPAIAGLVGVGISAALALLTGRAEDNFLPSLITNSFWLLALVVSLVVRRPLIGVIVALVVRSWDGWRADRAAFRVATIATLLWAALFAVRLAVSVPLYLASSAEGLAVARLLLGVPPYALLLWVTWLLVRSVARSRTPEDPEAVDPA